MSVEDAENTNPYVWIEQRTFESGKEMIKARKLFFLERLVDGKVYIFEGCGDQIPGIERLPDLHFTARVVSTLNLPNPVDHLDPKYWPVAANRVYLNLLPIFYFLNWLIVAPPQLPPGEWIEYAKTAKYYGYDKTIEVRPSRLDLKHGKGLTYDINQYIDNACSGIEVSATKLPGQSSLGQDLYTFSIKLRGLGMLSEDKVKRGDLNWKICID